MRRARVAAKSTQLRARVEQRLGFSSFAQAEVALGLVLVKKDRFPALASTVATVVVGALAVFELVGRISAAHAGPKPESRLQDVDPLLQLD